MQTEPNSPSPTVVVEPEQRTPEQVAADLTWLGELRAGTRARWGGIVGGHDAHLDTLETR